VFHVSIWGAWSFVWGAKPTKAAPRGNGTEQTVDKSWISCRSHHFFLQAFMNECSSCYYCSWAKALKLLYNEFTMQLTTG